MIPKKLLFLALFSLGLMISCSKDDGPSAPDKPTITSLSKTSGPVGTTFDILGTNFSTTKTQNTVKIGTTTASVSVATATKITTSVPQGATTGDVSVTVGGKIAIGPKFTVTQSQANNTAPVINNPDPVFSVVETLAIDVPVGTINATDADQDVLTYALSGTNSGHFMISATGVIGLAEGEFLDFETTPVYNLSVSVSDNNGGTATTDITINVTDVDEAPEVESLTLEPEAAENIADTDIIVTIAAVDPENATLEFSINTDASGLFEVDQDGAVSLISGKNLDFETSTEHTLSVDVSDGENTVTVTITITVTNVDEGLADDPASFITTWMTTADEEEIVIGLEISLVKDYDFQIDWGDGTLESYFEPATVNLAHTYETEGTYTVAIKGSFPAIKMSVGGSTPSKLLTIEQWGTNVWKSMLSAFSGCNDLDIYATDFPNVSEVTNMANMFANTFGLGSNPNTDFSNWDTSNVTNMSHAFENSGVNHPMAWNTISVTNMSSMFKGAIFFNQDLSTWDVSNVTDMSSMFENATAFDQSLGDWNIASVTNMENMLDGTALSTANYDSTLIGWISGEKEAQYNVTIGAEGLHYCEAGEIRAVLDVSADWNFVGDSEDPECP
ncbi:BspA family leucine-rich repeat surface protein [Flagellimonas iocasae]|uniref:BspA family leucine-rich repeat surface protein n=1 Tax=Flagellimonas iocasae TaxID=2055905 RepID=A0ABW4Y0U1_9FLAO